MYIRVDEGLGQPFMPQCPAGTQSAQSYTLPFGSAERDITDRDAPQIFKILCGPSPWQQHLRANLNAHLQDLPIQPIRIVIAGEFARRYGEIFNTPVPANAQGFVDRRNAIIYLKEFPAGNVGKSKVGLALHEAVHLFSHPAGKSNHLRGSAYLFLGEGLLEGLTQAITEDIQTAQGLRALRERWQAYKEYVPVAREIIRIFTPAVVGDAYFRGNLNNLLQAIIQRWGHSQFRKVQALTNGKKTNEALQLIRSLEQVHSNRPRIR
jgi:hypothetical protein